MRIVLMLLLLVGAFVPIQSAENFFSSSKWVTFTSAPGMSIERNPYRDEVWVGVDAYDAKTNTYLGQVAEANLPTDYSALRSVKFDDFGNAWVSTNKGVTRYNQTSKTSVHYSVADGLSSNNAGDLAFDKANNRLLLGTLMGGYSSVVLNSSGLPSAGWEKMVPTTTDKTIHSVGYWQGEQWAFNTEKVYKFANGSWTSYDIGVGSSFMDNDGAVWATVAEGTFPNQYAALYKFNRSSSSFEKVPVEGTIPGASIVIDRDRVMWLSGSQMITQIDLKVTPLVAKSMDLQAFGNEWINSPKILLKLNPVGGVIVGAYGAKEDTTGLAAYYQSITSVVRQPRIQSFTIARENAKFVGIFSANGKMVANPLSSSVLSSGNYFAVYRAADGSKIINRYLGLNSQSFPR